jgi:DNA-binding IclR family transcriptional regulator
MASDGALRLLNGFVRRGETAFSAAEFRHGMGMSPQATSNLLTRLTKVGLVDRVGATTEDNISALDSGNRVWFLYSLN